ncbi:MAG: hypothetical protein ACE37F_05005 [Nannocystaceae bacterium]|nr:hypothetical protein [bacterium]
MVTGVTAAFELALAVCAAGTGMSRGLAAAANLKAMVAKRGTIENGVVVLAEPTDAPNGTEVTVLIGRPSAVRVSDDELEAIDTGLREVPASARIDARAFLRELRAKR